MDEDTEIFETMKFDYEVVEEKKSRNDEVYSHLHLLLLLCQRMWKMLGSNRGVFLVSLLGIITFPLVALSLLNDFVVLSGTLSYFVVLL